MSARLAVVDDDPAFTSYLQMVLTDRGYAVQVYQSGDDLLHALATAPPPDVILLDVQMPGLDGIETLRAIRGRWSDTDVIMLSGRQAPATIVEAVRLGAADYVLKGHDDGGMTVASLEGAIRQALERQEMTAQIARLSAQVTDDPLGAQPHWSGSAALRSVMQMVDRVADSSVGVLLRGETGVGKEVIARELHRRSERRPRPFVKVNCAALPSELLESELFGHERGAFTGAGATRLGKFEAAHMGTLLLDEIGELPLALQAKLLHVVQDQQLTRIGSNRVVDVDVRLLAATNRDLQDMVRKGTFREDLYYRLRVVELVIPPLRDRRDEIRALIEYFIAKYAQAYRRPPVRPSRRLLELAMTYHWPGNIRELENAMKRLVVLQDESFILTDLHAAPPAIEPAMDVPRAVPVRPTADDETDVEPGDDIGEGVSLPDLARAAALGAERKAIEDALDRFRWNRKKAAAYLQISYKTLLNKLKELDLSQ